MMGIKEALFGAIGGLIIGVILMAYLVSQIGENLDPTTNAIFTIFVPILFCIAGAYMGYEYKN